LPVAKVVLDAAPAHLDRLFDYLVPEADSERAVPGVRVVVRFGAAEYRGFIVERVEASDWDGKLDRIKRVVSAERVLTPEVWALVEAVAIRYAGTRSDVLRLAIPPRHARAEGVARGSGGGPEVGPEVGREVGPGGASAAGPEAGEGGRPEVGVGAGPDGGSAAGRTTEPAAGGVVQSAPRSLSPDPAGLAPYVGGPAFARRVAQGEGPRAAWLALPWVGDEPGWTAGIASAVAAARAGGRGALVVLPDARDVRLLAEALERHLPDQPLARLQAEAGPEARYREFLRVSRGEAAIVIGTRAAAFAPVANLGLAVIWDDSAPTHREPRAPYPHAREVLASRAAESGAALLIGSLGRSAPTQALVDSDWLKELAPERVDRRRWCPAVIVPSDEDLAADAAGRARIPGAAHHLIRAGLAKGPVLVQVARSGYIPGLACAECRAPVRCHDCHGPLALSDDARLACGWCGRAEVAFHCERCGSTRYRSRQVGSARTAEELGRAFPDQPIVLSAADGPRGVIDSVPNTPAVVIATPGAEPVADGGYAAAALLDGYAAGGGDLDAGVAALSRWLAAAALVRPALRGGRAVLVGGPEPVAAGAFARWDPVGHATRDLAERAHLAFPPTVRMAQLTGPREAVTAFLSGAELPETAEVLGPLEDGPEVRCLVRAPLTSGRALLAALRAAKTAHSSRRGTPPIRIQIDPDL
jgi:primosomal protein N' (replication factor Y)